MSRICLITNCKDIETDDDRMGILESRWLASQLRMQGLIVDISSPQEAIHHSRQHRYDVFLLRNTWPINKFRKELQELADIANQNITPFSNPPDTSFGYIDNKSTFPKLIQNGLSVIPTILRKDDLSALGELDAYVIKPIDGCSSQGVKLVNKEQLLQERIDGQFIIQPFMPFSREVSFVFVDRKFQYAAASQTSNASSASTESLNEHFDRRWKMSVWHPNFRQIKWAQNFIDRLAPERGIVRVDAVIMPDSKLWLMEFERNCPHLSLCELNPALSFAQRRLFIKAVAKSLIETAQKPHRNTSFHAHNRMKSKTALGS